ncbi:putative ABC-2 type transporter [Nocardioidaceae bacterium Broad-1]|nr:putative ABC-2 type transporter [Nocardioidaceae bacterium Broad-1]
MTDYADTGPATAPTAPSGLIAGALRMGDYWLTVLARTWKGGVITTFVTPFFYVLALGVLLGGFVDADPATLEGASTYLAFVAPGMVAAHAMTIAFADLTYPVMGMLKWQRIYYSMIASPLAPSHIVLAQLGWVVLRALFACGVFLLVLAAFGVFETVWGVLVAWLVQGLVALAFATPVLLFSLSIKGEESFALIFRLGMIPLTLFSGTFFPIGNLGPVLEKIAMASPLWHGVDLTRMLTVGELDWSMVAIHVAYLGILAVVCWWLAIRKLGERLVS